MERASISRIEEWDSEPVPGGYVGLNELADDGFTGAVVTDDTRLFMLNGRIVGVFDGAMSAFEAGDANAYSAPDPSLPLLFAMKARGGEVRGTYYTDDTPISEVDDTLSSGGFTGYLELSENVLSGDYYIVYYGGRSLSAAFVGNEGRVVTGEAAFRLADDEVGIYEVRSIDLEVTDVPEPTEDGPGSDVEPGTSKEPAASTGPVDDPAEQDSDLAPDDGTEGDSDVSSPEGEDPASEPGSDGREEDLDVDPETSEERVDSTDPVEDPVEDDAGPGSTVQGADESETPQSGEGLEGSTEADDEAAVIEDAETGAAASTATADGDSNADTRTTSEPRPGETGGAGNSPSGRQAAEGGRPPGSPGEPDESEPDERFEEEARWRETRTVPALDPEDSEQPTGQRQPGTAEPAVTVEPEPPSAGSDPLDTDDERHRSRVKQLEAELAESERARRQLTERLDEVVDERDRLEAERASLADRIEQLEDRIEEAEAGAAVIPPEGGSASAGADDTPDAPSERPTDRAVGPETALDQTDLFVRYRSKAEPTLQTAHDGRAGLGEVNENLRIETHSRFDAATVTVDGQPFDAFLEGSIQYRFVQWLVEDLIYEIQETGTESGLRAVYDLLPVVDRTEFNGTVTGSDGADGERELTFDVICRDRMGKPLVVANINDSLDPADADMMARLVEDATDAGEAHGSIGAAFLVTASFFAPDALETAADATRSGGFLSRESKKSFVKLARSGGYHLCLVEARGDDFHVAVPEF